MLRNLWNQHRQKSRESKEGRSGLARKVRLCRNQGIGEEEEICSQLCQLRKSSQLARDVAVELITAKVSVGPTPSESHESKEGRVGWQERCDCVVTKGG